MNIVIWCVLLFYVILLSFNVRGKSLEFGRDTICIDISYSDENSPTKYYNSSEKSRTFEIVSDRNHTIRYDSASGTAYMKHPNGQYVKMERQSLGEKFFKFRNSVLNVTVPCKKSMQKRKYILTDIVTNKPRRERNSRTV